MESDHQRSQMQLEQDAKNAEARRIFNFVQDCPTRYWKTGELLFLVKVEDHLLQITEEELAKLRQMEQWWKVNKRIDDTMKTIQDAIKKVRR